MKVPKKFVSVLISRKVHFIRIIRATGYLARFLGCEFLREQKNFHHPIQNIYQWIPGQPLTMNICWSVYSEAVDSFRKTNKQTKRIFWYSENSYTWTCNIPLAHGILIVKSVAELSNVFSLIFFSIHHSINNILEYIRSTVNFFKSLPFFRLDLLWIKLVTTLNLV